MITKLGDKYAFKCNGCGKVEGGFPDKADAQVALRLHQVGCKRS